jgi:glycogen(starch) synthase
MIRTLQIGNDWFEDRQGGLSRFYSELLRYFPATQVEVEGLVAGTDKAQISSGGRVVAFALAHEPIAIRLLHARQAALTILHNQKIDIVASHFALYALPILDKLRSIPSVVHFHGPWAAEAGVEGSSFISSRIQAAIERAVYSHANRVIVLSRAFQQELVRSYGISEELIRVVPGGVDLERFNITLTRGEARERLGWPSDRPIILAVRRQMRRMGLENLIDASRALIKTNPDLLVFLAGSGPISNELKLRIAEYGLDKSIRLLGRVDDADLPLAYRAADLTVVPSQTLEGFGMITLESLASGTAVFVSPIGGLPEVIGPFAPQCVFDGTSAKDIQVALAEALCGQRTLPTAEECRQYASTNFSWPVIAERIQGVYQEALA